MTKNMGNLDRVVRGLIGVIALLGAFVLGWFSGWALWLAVIVGAVMLITSVVGVCPLYRMVGLNTCRI